ncbi:hypothetical protein QTP86_003798 [Hemibagrus guttatus]|nr:hypothetical protein QTP86_003798 [Hemibagrus guttatus]
MEKYRDGQRELHCVFVDLEKAYDRVPREELWYCLRKSGVAEKYVKVVQDMYERSRTVVSCAVGQKEEFKVEVGLHQGSALSPFLFAMVMDQLSEKVREESPWTMMFADDIVICSESREQVEENLERWRFVLERRGMKVSRSKTEYMCVNEREGSRTVRLQGEEVKKVQEFKYLGSTVQSNGECRKEIKKRVQAGWNGWRKVSGVLCGRKISARIKGKVYKTVVRLAMLYGLETVSLRKRQESELEVAELQMLRDRIKSMFYHAYNNYLENAYPYDELRPLTCDGQDTWGSFSLTLIDALDTLLILGNHTEFQRVAALLQDSVNFDIDVNASVFETNIRVVGGLLSAHLLSKKAGISVEEGWPCSGPLLRLAEDAARKLLPAFHTPTGMPYGTVNLLRGVNPTETPITCTAGVGTFILEFSTLSHLTGDPVFEDVARKALNALWKTRSDIGLVGNHIDVITSKWVAQDAGIGAGIDSYFEYLLKGAIMLQDEELLNMFYEFDKSIKNYTKFDDWYLWVQMHKGTVSMPIFQSLEAFWPGLQSLVGDVESATRTFHNYCTVWRQFGGLPEFYSIPQGYTVDKREGYPLRPELIESAMYLYKATGNPTFLQLGRDVVESIEKISYVKCGFASVKDVRDHKLDNRMESFFLAETIKYLYLLFDPDNFIHNTGTTYELGGAHGNCILGAGGYIFNTEAHPIDPAALHCCSKDKDERLELQDILLSLAERYNPSVVQSEESLEDRNSESIILSPGERRNAFSLSCPMQSFSARFAVMGQVFSDST